MSDPSLWMASALSASAFVAILIGVSVLRRAGLAIHGAVLMAIGAAANGLVLIANNGMMPVHGMPSADNHGVWRSADEGGHLLFLADRMWLAGSSPGDVLVLVGVAITLVVVLRHGRRTVLQRARVSAS